MRLFLLALAMPLLAGSAAAQPPVRDAEPASDARKGPAIGMPPLNETCRDPIISVREERGLPPLEPRRDNAEADEAEALMILAVDRDIDGCDVLVMASDPLDIRPLPQFDREDWRVRPAPHRGPYRRQ